MRARIEKKSGIGLGLTAVGRLLASLAITPQKPLRRADERDPQRIRKWLKQDYPALRRRAKKYRAKIYFLDEAGVRSDPVLGRTYGLKGHTPVVATSGQRQSINAISAVHPKGEFGYNVYSGKLNASRFVEFLKDLMKGRRERVFLVVDGHPSHTAKLVPHYIRSLAGKLEVHFLPPYAPDLNPDEFVWAYTKASGLSKKPRRQNESLRERVTWDLESIRRNRSLVRSFFCAESVAYAADL